LTARSRGVSGGTDSKELGCHRVLAKVGMNTEGGIRDYTGRGICRQIVGVSHMARAALLRTSGVAFRVLKYVDVAYLLYMAWRTLRETGEIAVTETAARSPLRIITSAVSLNLLDPKLTLFFFAFLPQFVDPHRTGATWQMLELGVHFMAMTLAIFLLYGLLAAAVRDKVLSRPRFTRWLRRIFAGSFAALGAKLVLTER
jgi:threonine/homoserine/homoserine lactone efflux protein